MMTRGCVVVSLVLVGRGVTAACPASTTSATPVASMCVNVFVGWCVWVVVCGCGVCV